MKITDANATASSAADLARTRRTEDAAEAARKDPAGGASESADQVQFSDLSNRVLSALKANSPDHAARVERLAAQFQAEKYEPDPHAISRSMVDEALTKE